MENESKSQLDQLERTVLELHDSKQAGDKVGREVEKLSSSNRSLLSQIERTTEENESLHHRISGLIQDVEEKAKHLVQQERALNHSQEEVAILRANVRTLEKELSLFEESLPMFESAMDESAASMEIIHELTKKIKDLTERNNWLSSCIAELQQQRMSDLSNNKKDVMMLGDQLEFLSSALVGEELLNRDLHHNVFHLSNVVEELSVEKEAISHAREIEVYHWSHSYKLLQEELGNAKSALEMALLTQSEFSPLVLTNDDIKSVEELELAASAKISSPPHVDRQDPSVNAALDGENHLVQELQEKLATAELRLGQLSEQGSQAYNSALKALSDDLVQKNSLLEHQAQQVVSQQHLIDEQLRTLEAMKLKIEYLSSHKTISAPEMESAAPMEEEKFEMLKPSGPPALIKLTPVVGSLVSGFQEYFFDEKLDEWIPKSTDGAIATSVPRHHDSGNDAVKTLQHLIAQSKNFQNLKQKSISSDSRIKFSFEIDRYNIFCILVMALVSLIGAQNA
eukprot:TRINITY_DN71387_c0_g1_i1.p1 TRINITY_DN71387_c0_g1~~TRINITY_DN71387_c0_g1_i1.p1  ORF type:complete len:520 (-),score=154.81 TRINITY_DN71387_c0_g1_i1:76-1608(-)